MLELFKLSKKNCAIYPFLSNYLLSTSRKCLIFLWARQHQISNDSQWAGTVPIKYFCNCSYEGWSELYTFYNPAYCRFCLSYGNRTRCRIHINPSIFLIIFCINFNFTQSPTLIKSMTYYEWWGIKVCINCRMFSTPMRQRNFCRGVFHHKTSYNVLQSSTVVKSL